MIKQLFKPFAFILFSMALFAGNISVAQAEPFDNNVKDCLESPEKCGQETGQKEDEPGGQSQQIEKERAVGVTFWDFLKMIGALAFVLALIYFLLRFVNQKSRSYQQTKLIQHLGGSPLGGNRSIQMVKVGDRILILGVGEDIQLIKEIDDEQELTRFIDHYSEQMDQMLQPQDVITKLISKWKSKETPTDGKQDEFKKMFESKLSEMKRSRNQTISKMSSKEKKHDE
ncbi:flagellar biosynthesis protein FliZ [Bacillus aerolatus]|uniref:Flagellar biosynthesis protein FliZ n=1 Tax=Bacillus aerolatus TaxID=2653354 RepID=A0A6I1FIA2_9BACI|nr:flagellar biosynthetic protein FliO [Bacillus aerolatus]KAB7708062.1 flagellar biosynthesis protein FliZ [Bacillus aerolatus]